jgi:methionyl-tRNA formyltransferase
MIEPASPMNRATAVVFAYHNVGCRCLAVLLAHGVRVPLVVTHVDSSSEPIWFDSVASLASSYDIPVVTPDSPDAPELIQSVARVRPDFLFSFYYRHMLSPVLLASAGQAALNMHGSLLPKYRGRAPVNWAVLHGERETGATLHYMTGKPDAGDIVDQERVPILPDDTARDVLDKVVVAAEVSLDRVLPALLAGRAPRRAQDLARGSYFGARTPADSRIDWRLSHREVHNLVRAVAPPFPAAFTFACGQRIVLHATRLVTDRTGQARAAALYCRDGRCYAQCQDQSLLRVLSLELDGVCYSEAQFAAQDERSVLFFDPQPADESTT